jgi:nitrogen-specific signal transduction histidine kinase
MMTDLTARNQLQADLLQAQKIEAMGRLSGGVAHDFNNLLTAILGFSELLQMSLKDDDPRRDDVRQIIETSHRAAALTRQLLAFSRKQVLKPVALEANAVIADMEKMLKRIIGEDVSLGTRLNPALGVCRADRGQFEQVILNLVVNARDAMPKGGSILLSTDNAVLEASEAKGLGAAPGAFVRVEVADTGEGMSEETLRRIFEPFFTTKPVGKGTGLGLATVHGIVKQSGGLLKVRSKLGKGTTFEVLLPAIPRPQEDAPEQAKAAARAGHETVLVVDDDATIRQVARRLLTSAGYRVLEAEGGAEGLALLDREEGPIELLITDVVLSGMTGFDFAAQARRRRPRLRALIMSGYLDREPPQGAAEVEFFLQKPFAAEAFTAKVREVLDASAPPA